MANAEIKLQKEALRPELNPSDALNNPEFLKYLAQDPNTEKIIENKQTEELEAHLEAFKSLKLASQDLKDFYDGEMAKLGLEPTTELDKIDPYLAEKSLKNPREAKTFFENIRNQIKEHVELSQKIQTEEARIEELMGTPKEIAARKENLGKQISEFQAMRVARDLIPERGFFKKKLTPETPLQKKAVEKTAAQWDIEIQKLQEAFATPTGSTELEAAIKNKEEAERKFGNIKSMLFEGLSVAQEIVASAKEKAKQEFKNRIGTGEEVSLQTLRSAREYHKAAEAGPFEIEHTQIEGKDLKEWMGRESGIMVKAELTTFINKFQIGPEPFKNFEQSIHDWIDSKQFGSLDKEQALSKLHEVLIAAKNWTSLNTTEEGRQKKYLVLHFLNNTTLW